MLLAVALKSGEREARRLLILKDSSQRERARFTILRSANISAFTARMATLRQQLLRR
jgi:hypothetical protein